MNTDWKALCAELADVLAEEYGVQREFDSGDPLLGSGAIELLSRARTALSQPEPEGLTDEELLQIAAATIDPYESRGIALDEYEAETECAVEAYGSELIAFARSVLARWPLAAIKPIPVSERLPGPEDCMDEGWAWFYTPRGDWIKAVLPVSPAYTHWLPHYALPIPTTTTETP